MSELKLALRQTDGARAFGGQESFEIRVTAEEFFCREEGLAVKGEIDKFEASAVIRIIVNIEIAYENKVTL